MTKVVYYPNAGRRFTHTGDAAAKKIWNKAWRRLVRASAMRDASPIERALRRCREDDLEVARLATNSHQRQRAIAADRRERTTRKGTTE